MKIRTRAFIVLWLMTILGVGAIGFILVAINVIAPTMDAERQRIAEVLDLHSSLWRALVELKHDQHDQVVLALPSIRERLQRQRSAVNDYLAHEASLVQDAGQKDRLKRLTQQYEKWVAQWEAADPSGSPEYVLSISEKEFAPVEAMLREFDARERQLGTDAVAYMAGRRQLFFAIVASIAGVGALTLVAVMLSTKKVILDPLTELTDSAHRIEMGDFTAAHQTLRADEIGVLINSFAKMVQAVQLRERELATALGESRELASVTSESRRRVEAAHADLLATLETVPAALLIFNPDGSIRLRNRAATDVFGIEPQNRSFETITGAGSSASPRTARRFRRKNGSPPARCAARPRRTKSSRFIIPTAASFRSSPAARRSGTSSGMSPVRWWRSRTLRAFAKSIA